MYIVKSDPRMEKIKVLKDPAFSLVVTRLLSLDIRKDAPSTHCPCRLDSASMGPGLFNLISKLWQPGRTYLFPS